MNVPGKGNGRQWVGKSATRLPTVSDTRMRTPTQAVRLVVGDLVPFSLCRVLSGEVKSRLYLLACAAPALGSRMFTPTSSTSGQNTSRPQLRLCFRGATIKGASEATSCPTMTAPRLTTRVPRSSATTSRAQTLRSDSAGSPTILQGRRSSLQPPVRPRHLSGISCLPRAFSSGRWTLSTLQTMRRMKRSGRGAACRAPISCRLAQRYSPPRSGHHHLIRAEPATPSNGRHYGEDERTPRTRVSRHQVAPLAIIWAQTKPNWCATDLFGGASSGYSSHEIALRSSSAHLCKSDDIKRDSWAPARSDPGYYGARPQDNVLW